MKAATEFSDQQREFALAFYLSIKEQNEATLQRRTGFIKLSLIGTFSFYAAIFSPALGIVETRFLMVTIWMPIVFNFVGFFLELASADINEFRGKIMSRIESDVGVTYWDDFDQRRKKSWYARPFTNAGIGYWISIIVMNIFVATYVAMMGSD